MKTTLTLHVESLEAWATDYYNRLKWEDDHEPMPEPLATQYKRFFTRDLEALEGDIIIITPDGQAWQSIRGVDPSVSDRLSGYLDAHGCDSARHMRGLPCVFIQATLNPDLSRVFCFECRKYVDATTRTGTWDQWLEYWWGNGPNGGHALAHFRGIGRREQTPRRRRHRGQAVP